VFEILEINQCLDRNPQDLEFDHHNTELTRWFI